MPTTSHTVALSINGSAYTSLLKQESLYVRHSIGNDNGVCDFKIEDNGTYTPQGWDAVSIAVNGTTIFGGFIFQHDAEVLGAGTTKQTVWQVQCKDWSILLDRVIVEEEYKEQSDASIIADLFSTYLAGEGFDTNTNVSTVNADLDIAFYRLTLREALNQLAARVDAQWYIAPDKKLTWKAFAGFPNAAFNIDTVSPNDSTTFDVAYSSLRRQVDASTIINKVVIVGGDSKSGARQQDTFAANGTTDTFGPLTQAPHSIWSVDYWLAGGRWIRYSTNIGYEPGDKLISEGGEFEIVCNLESQVVRIRHRDGSVPDNSTNVVIDYYYLTPITTTREHTGSQNYYGRVFTENVFNQELTSLAAAETYGDTVLARHSFGRETINFDVYEHGLQPGTRITINAPSVGLGTTVTQGDLVLEYDLTDGYVSTKDVLLIENSDLSVLEVYGADVRYVIQEVQYQPVLTATGNYMIVAKVSVGDWQHTIIDALQRIGSSVSGNGAGGGALSMASGRSAGVVRRGGRLSNVSNDLGDIVSGRALFTDGGTGIFDWDNYAGHTGAIVGLEDSGTTSPYGAVYILDAGTVKAKLGRMAGMPSVGTVTPTGWGLWTTNGYFQGVVAASELIGGTITGGQITGGTITGGIVSGGTVSGALVTGGTVSGNLVTGGTLQATLGTIGGFTIESSKLWSNNGTIATGSIVNSSNPGVYLNNLGLFGYGTLGLTFALYTDPALKPWFSSGTINNVVYEVYESAILRTSANPFADGGIQMDNSGLFGINPQTGAGALLLENGSDILLTENSLLIYFAGIRFMLDTTTGNLHADSAWITGTIYATDGEFSGTVYAAAGSFAGTVSASQITGGTITGGQIRGGTVFGALITGVTVTATQLTSGTITGVTVTANTLSGNTISGGTITGAVVTANTISGNTVSGGTVTGSTITASQITGGTISSPSLISVAGGTLTLTDSGMRITPSNGGTIWGTRDGIQWMRNGSIMTEVSSWNTGSRDALAFQTGRIDVGGSIAMYAWTNGTTPSLYSGIAMGNGTVDINAKLTNINGGRLRVAEGFVSINGDLIHDSVWSLGNTGVGWRYLYMYDSNFDVWRVEVNTSGALVVTAA